ncbi:MAG: hypothetical protein JXA20_00555 [Spirochaetes bacterium]|nr:hypothetical protein [Spirochaetota bacterium]
MRHAIASAICALTLSCAAVGPVLQGDPSGRIDSFLGLCEADLRSARKVIEDNGIIKNLTHLQYMNAGGSKYYLLERENISKMITSVTAGIYSDYILINKKGTVIYTKENDSIFAKNVRTSLAGTPLAYCYGADGEIRFGNLDTAHLRTVESIYPSIAIPGDDRSAGVFILQIDKERVRRLLNEGSAILDAGGTILVSRRPQEEGTLNIPAAAYIEKSGAPSGKTDIGGGMWLRPYRRGPLELLILSGLR